MLPNEQTTIENSMELRCSGGDGAVPEITVREWEDDANNVVPEAQAISCLAHPSNGLPIQLNCHWRVVDDDLQYILQRRKGNARSKSSGWIARSFCRTCEGLLRCIREDCGPVDDDALDQVRALPEWHIDR